MNEQQPAFLTNASVGCGRASVSCSFGSIHAFDGSAGLTKVSLREYLLGTVGIVPGTLAFVYIGASTAGTMNEEVREHAIVGSNAQISEGSHGTSFNLTVHAFRQRTCFCLSSLLREIPPLCEVLCAAAVGGRKHVLEYV